MFSKGQISGMAIPIILAMIGVAVLIIFAFSHFGGHAPNLMG